MKFLPILFILLLLTYSCEETPKRKAKPIDSTKVFTFDTLLTNPGKAGGSSTVKRVNLKGNVIDVWKKDWNEEREYSSSHLHYNLLGEPVYSIDSVFNSSNKLTEMTRSIDSLSEYQKFYFNSEGDTVKTLIAIHTRKYFVVMQRTHSSKPAYTALLDGNPKSKIDVKEVDFFNAQKSFNMKCEIVGMLPPKR